MGEGGRPPRAVGLAWGFLTVNTLGYIGVAQIIPFPRFVGQIITMGMLVTALTIALLVNRRVYVRPNAYLVLLTLIFIVSVVSSMRLESGVGSLFRCFRMGVFVLTLWLLSGWWRGDLRFVSYHIRALAAILLTVLAGLVISPSAAFSGPEGRLVGAIWPIPAPQVGLYCAIVTGLSVLLYLGGGWTDAACWWSSCRLSRCSCSATRARRYWGSWWAWRSPCSASSSPTGVLASG